MNKISNVLIIGLGLIGGSLAKALRKSFEELYIVACDNNIDTINKSCKEGVADLGFCITNIEDYVDENSGIIDKIKKSDIIFFCTNIDTCKDIAEKILPFVNKNTIVTDVCSTKAELFDFFESYDKEVLYIGGHPMTGSEKSGYDAATSYLFENAIYILCPLKNIPQEVLVFFKEIIKRIGAIPYPFDPKDHDAAIARVSHLPHILASTLVNAVSMKETPNGDLRLFAAGGFNDMTRISSGDPDLWTSIVTDNDQNISEAIDDCIDILRDIQGKIEKNDREGVKGFFKEAKEYRYSFDSNGRIFMNLMYELSLDVEDKPGVIADITTKLRTAGINIKNIYISESREHENGCLRLVFDNKKSREDAKNVVGGTYL